MIPSVVASQIKNCVADYLCTTFHPTTSGFENLIHHFLQTPNQYYRGPYINIGLPFRPSDRQGEPFPEIPLGFQPHRHQAIAFQRLSPPNYQSTIVATGTGSGKTECFLLPILEHCRQQQRQQGIKAILIYPMNALATDQAKRIAQLIDKHPSLQGKVTAGLYVGDQEDKPMLVMSEKQIITDRYTLRNSPPDILLTNYKMLDLLLMQPENQTLWRNNKSETLRYLVVDEFHTFDGAQGTDLACLLRRLKHRLKTPENHLVCVGTSATLGSEDTRKDMVHYAQDIFQEIFDPESLIRESRLTVKEFLRLDEVEDLLMVFPPSQEKLALLKPESYPNKSEFIYAQARLWLKQNCPPFEVEEDFSLEWRLALGKTLKQLPLIHNVLRFFDDQGKGTLVPRTYIELGEKLETLLGISPNSDSDYILALIDSLLSLMAIARTEIEKHDGSKLIVPWVNLRVQVWFRELKRMVASIESEPKLLFSDDLKPEQLSKALPVMHCRSCGATGWAGLRPQQGMDKLSLNNLQDFYQAFFARRRSPNLAFIFPCNDEQQQENIKQFCPQCLTLNAPRQTSCKSCGHQDLIRVQVPDISDTETENGQKYTVSKSDCPFCKNPNGLSILGAQSASLTSAMIGVLFTSPFNTDKKLLTFSDSVQDAAHRAGFYTARTYNTTLRTAIAKSLQDAPENITLAEFIPYFSHYWQAKLPRQADFVATFLPNDLGWLREWDEFLQSDRQELSPTSTLIEKSVKPRLEWEIITQFGHRAAVGPSLERSGICSLQFLPAQLQQIASLLQKRLSNEIEALRGITIADLHPYLLGFLHHLRLQGAILQPATKSYIQNASNVYLLGKNQYYMPNIGPGNPKPKFLANHSANAQHFETLAYRGKRSHWSEDWARRCLQSISLLLQDQLIEVLHQTLECLEEIGLLKVEKCGAGRAWGLPQSQLYLSLSAQIFACNQCGSSLTSSNQEANTIEGMVCLKQGCSGHYQPAPENALSYYRKLYQQGEIYRIYALEHTGLLKRENRERLENRFIQGDRLCDPNLLSATSTLEMGINIGDLSSVVLCSIPPNTANFQQRLGRAGRTDGNAFATAIANGKAHDLYFYSNPVKMIQGNINPAGCYLDASAILERQLAAFCLDNWVCHSSETAAIPKQLRDILNNLNGKKSDKFPYTWLYYIEQHQTQLLTDFLALFQGAITEETATQLYQFMDQGQGNQGGLRWTILNHFEGINREVTRLRSQQANLREKIKKYKLQPAALQDVDELAELEQERRAFMELIRSIENKKVLNFLTDEGFLPNYAFPESGVTLRSIIWRKTETTETEGKRYDHQTLEYERPGKVAIRELVPGGTFYAEGRKVKIDQVDLQLSKPQDWRFCPKCSYAIEAALPEGKQKICPRCHHSLWSDQGQVRKMLKLQQVFARTSDKESRFGDDTEERQPSFFQRSLLVDFNPEHRERTLLNTDETFPFGLEYIAKTTFREINLGENTSNGDSLTIGGNQFSTKGFRVCGGCGKEMTPKNEPKDHAINCQYRHKTDRAKSLEVLYLYRQFESESIRFLMPNEGFWSDKGLHSFIAALQLGLKEKFKGKVDHLNVATSEEPQADSPTRKSFLYLYDSVPGGTGYLKQLIRDPEKLKDIFLKAQKIVTACGCEDGCYECLFAYRNSFKRDQTSRNTAKKLLKSLLNHWETLAIIDNSLSSIKIDTNLDGELEKMLIEAIPAYQYPSLIHNLKGEKVSLVPELRKEIFNGKTGYLLTIGQQKWRIETQVTLNERDNVTIQTRADFVFYPISRNRPDLKPIAIYTDGWEYHQDRLQDDFEKRLAILRSHNYLCWSLTWEDVNSHYQEQEQRLDLPLNALITGLNERFQKESQAIYEQYQCQDLQNLESQDSFVWLMHYLAKPDPLLWQRWALFRTFIQADFNSLKNQSLQAKWIENITQRFGEIAIENWRSGNPIFVGEINVSPTLNLWIAGDLARHRQGTADASFVAIQLQPESETTTNHSLKIAWREALRLLNLYQFLDPVYITLADQPLTDALIVEPLPPQKNPWEDIQPLIVEADVLAQLPNLIAQNVPVGEPGYELCDQSGEVLAIAELAWINAQVALTTTPEDHQQFIAQGWQSWQCADFFEQLTTIIPLLQR